MRDETMTDNEERKKSRRHKEPCTDGSERCLQKHLPLEPHEMSTRDDPKESFMLTVYLWGLTKHTDQSKTVANRYNHSSFQNFSLLETKSDSCAFDDDLKHLIQPLDGFTKGTRNFVHNFVGTFWCLFCLLIWPFSCIFRQSGFIGDPIVHYFMTFIEGIFVGFEDLFLNFCAFLEPALSYFWKLFGSLLSPCLAEVLEKWQVIQAFGFPNCVSFVLALMVVAVRSCGSWILVTTAIGVRVRGR